MPYPSAACQTCKTRRIKCDETKPICERCTKSKRECIPVIPARNAAFQIHLENPFASGKTKRPRGPRSSLGLWRPPVDIETVALAYYLQYHFQAQQDVPGLSISLAECVTQWRDSGHSNTMVDLAISSIALATFSKIHNHAPAAKQASSGYYRLLRIAQKQMLELQSQTLDQTNVDACMLSVSLMGRFEGVVHNPGDTKSDYFFPNLPTWSHHDGVLAILKFWHDYPGKKTKSFTVKHARRGLIKSCLLRNIRVPNWMLNGNGFGEEGAELEYDQIMVCTVNQHYECQCLQYTSIICVDKVTRLIAEVRELDRKMEEWILRVPADCYGKRHLLVEQGPFPRKHFYRCKVCSYHKPGYAGAWSQLFALRMLIIAMRLRLLNMSRPNCSIDFDLEQERLDCITKLQIMSDGIASSIPFGLERIMLDSSGSMTVEETKDVKPYLANLLVWPLTIASSVQETDPDQRRWFRSELGELGKVIGEGVIASAETEEWGIL